MADHFRDREFYEQFWEDSDYQLAYAFDSAVRDRFPAIQKVWGTLRPPVRVLDFGCGNGVLTYWLKANGFGQDVLGIDVSKTGVSFAQCAFSCSGLEYRTVDQVKFESETGVFDVVVSSHVLEHISKPGNALRLLLPLAEWFIIEVPLERCWLQSLIWVIRGKKQVDNPLGHVNFWTRQSFLRFLRENDLMTVREHQYASAPFSPYNSPFKRFLEQALLNVLGIRGYGILMATHFVVLARKNWGLADGTVSG